MFLLAQSTPDGFLETTAANLIQAGMSVGLVALPLFASVVLFRVLKRFFLSGVSDVSSGGGDVGAAGGSFDDFDASNESEFYHLGYAGAEIPEGATPEQLADYDRGWSDYGDDESNYLV